MDMLVLFDDQNIHAESLFAQLVFVLEMKIVRILIQLCL
jgi:hypothetical protein